MILLLIKYMYTSKSLTFSITLFVLLFDCKSSHIWRSNRTHPPEVIFKALYNIIYHFICTTSKKILFQLRNTMEEESLPEYSPSANPPQPTATNPNTAQRQLGHTYCWPILIFYIVKSGSRKNLYQFQSVKRFEE